MFTLEEQTREWERRHPQYTPKATPENEKRYREMELAANIAWLQKRIAELDAELDATGLDDALDWERFPELEKLLYALGERVAEQREIERERKAEREREIDAAYAEFELWDEWDETDFEYGDELDFDAEQLVEMVDEMQEASMVELEQFGCIEFEPQFNWSAKSTPDERGWSRAMVDIIAFEGEDAEPLFELF